MRNRALRRPRKNMDRGWCAHILDREARAWHELHSFTAANFSTAAVHLEATAFEWENPLRVCRSAQIKSNCFCGVAWRVKRPTEVRVGPAFNAAGGAKRDRGVFTRADAVHEIPDCRLSHRRIPPIGREEGDKSKTRKLTLDHLTLIPGLSTVFPEPSACGSI
jgi:hypothetical protein